MTTPDQLLTLRRILQSADRIIARQSDLEVKVAESGAAPAWSDGDSITLNASSITQTDLTTLINVYGLNYHEIAHILYTPRSGSMLGEWIRERGHLMPAFNSLEDQRIESLLVARFPSVAPYLTSTVLRFLADNPSALSLNYPLVRGRRYLPVNVRSAFRAAFRHQSIIRDITKIVDEYRTLVFPRDYDRAKVLIQAWYDVMETVDPHQNPYGSCGSRDLAKSGRPESQTAQKTDAEKVDNSDRTDEEFVPPAPAQPKPDTTDDDVDADDDTDGAGAGSDESDDDADGQSGDSDSDESGDDAGSDGDDDAEGMNGDDSSDGDTTDQDGAGSDTGDADSDSDSSSSTPAGSTAGTGSADEMLEDDVLDAIEDALSDIESDRDVLKEMNATRNILQNGDGEYDSTVDVAKYATQTPSPVDAAVSKRFEDELRRLIESVESGWERETYSGRVNAARVVRGCDITEAFDRWDEGEDGANLEVVLLVDRSGSMGYEPMQLALNATWSIARALERVHANCTVIAFDNDTHLLYKRGERVTAVRHLPSRGGTVPSQALEEARRILTSTRKKYRVLITLTDGDWSRGHIVVNGRVEPFDNDKTIEDLGKAGVITSMCYLHTGSYDFSLLNMDVVREHYSHNASIFTALRTATDLVPFAKQVVTTALRQRPIA